MQVNEILARRWAKLNQNVVPITGSYVFDHSKIRHSPNDIWAMSNMYLPSQKVKEFLKYANNAGDQNWLLNRMNSIPVTVVEQLQSKTNDKTHTKKK